MLNKGHIKGKVAEYVSLLLLMVKGYKPLTMNDRSVGIEADIIASKGSEIALVEVKWRQSQERLHVAVHPVQQERLKRKLRSLQKKYPGKVLSIHLMLICPTPPFIEHIKNPF